VLLIWGDLPHWMVVDREFEGFLHTFDGSRRAADTNGVPPELAEVVADLRKRDVLTEADELRTPVPDEPRYIENVTINLTRRCSLRCTHCYLPAGTPGAETPVEEVERFLREVRPLCSSHPSLVLLGGEPTLEREKLLRTLEMGKRLGFECLLSTNAQGINESLAEALAKSGAQVQVSLDGATAVSNDAIRGQDSFGRACSGIRMLVGAGVRVVMSMVVTRGNQHELRSYLELAMAMGVAEARFIPLRAVGEAKWLRNRIVPLTRLLQGIRELLESNANYRKLLRSDAFSILGTTCQLSQRRISCGTGRQTLLLDADGKLYPCANLHHEAVCFGALGESWQTLWASSPVLQKVRVATNVGSLRPPCCNCAVRYWCLGGCRGEAYSASNDLSAPSPHCRELHEAVIEMFWTLADSPQLVRSTASRC